MEFMECSFVFRQIRSKAELRKRRTAEVDDENTYRFKFTHSHADLKKMIFRQNKYKPELIECDKLKPEVEEEADRGDNSLKRKSSYDC